MIRNTVLLATLCLCAPTIDAQTVYRWVDENGVTHYGEKRPDDGSDASELRLKSQKGADPAATAKEDVQESAPSPPGDPTMAQMKAHDRALCERARESLRVLQEESVVVRRDSRSGERRVMSAEEVAESIKGAQAEVAHLCEPEEAQ